jgi:hypothetical protein
MPDESISTWKNQPEEKTPVNLQQSLSRRAYELHWSTRWEIVTSIAAALFFSAVIWRFAVVPPYAYGAVLAWVAISVIWFRGRIWTGNTARPDAIAANGLAHYRRELQTRRDHLRNAWIWHGPLVLACLIVASTFADRRYPGAYGLQTLAPVALILIAWTAFRIRTRLRLARQIDEELKDLDHSNAPNP